MVFGRIGEIFSSVSSHWYSPQSVILPYESSPPEDTREVFDSFPFPSSLTHNKNTLRHSSSLQDFSSYRDSDPKEPDIALLNANKYPNFLKRETAGSSFSKEKALQTGGSLSKQRKWLRAFMLLLGLLLLGVLIYYLSIYAYYWSQGAYKYFVVLDCGSTGTRIYIYQAYINHNKDGSLPIDLKPLTEGVKKKPNSQSGRAYNRMETEPGLHKLVHNITGLRAAIKPLIRWAEKQIPEIAHKTTSVFLYTTAGVRRLPSEDSKWLLDNAWSILKNSPFFCRREWIKIISGMEEGYFGWIALNHRAGMLGTKPKMQTYGALDLGGSSLQVTFENDKSANAKTSLNIRIGSMNHHLTAYSLSGYGLNDAFEKSVLHLLKKLPDTEKVEILNGKKKLQHPCLHSGYKERYICSQCASKYQQGVSPVVAEKTSGKGGKLGIAVRLNGAPNWEACSALAKIAVNLSEWTNINSGIDCDVQPCALSNGFPRPYGQFYALSGFYVVYRFFNLTSEASLDDVLEKGREFCEKTWEIAKNSVAPQPFIQQYCFRAPYIVSLLREGLHIIDNQIVIGSGSITWTLGVALLEAGKAFSSRMDFHSYDILQMKINPIILLTVLFISLVFFLLCASSCIGNWMAIFFRRSYLPLFRYNSASSASVLNISSPFRFQRWSPTGSGDGRVKTPLSPTVAGSQHRPFGLSHGLASSSGIQLMESSLYLSTSSFTHSYSLSNLGQMQHDGGSMASFWSPHGGQMRLQSRRSQSREDLNSSLADQSHLVKV